jgi:single-strand selective monofunctional uracil DNA glycosylase
MDRPALLLSAADRLCRALAHQRFTPPVSHVYNPLEYARAPYEQYVRRYAASAKQVLFFGMNPGPYGMTQTGVPFGEIQHVRDWLGIEAPVAPPAREHPRRKITGFDCTRSEVSGARLWGLWRATYGEPQRFFAWAFITNYCPLVFMEESGRNLTPDKLKPAERSALLGPCDEHLRAVVAALEPSWVVGVGAFAKARAQAVLGDARVHGKQIAIASIPHPSPASPAANKDWAGLALRALDEQGVPRPR